MSDKPVQYAMYEVWYGASSQTPSQKPVEYLVSLGYKEKYPVELRRALEIAEKEVRRCTDGLKYLATPLEFVLEGDRWFERSYVIRKERPNTVFWITIKQVVPGVQRGSGQDVQEPLPCWW